MKKKTAKRVEPLEVPEVVEFMDAQDALNAFKAEYPEVFEQLSQLTERYNTTLEQADKACRGQNISCGPFDLYQFTTKYSVEELFNAIGRDKFLEVGGKIETTTTYSIDRGRLEAAIATKKVPDDVAKSITTTTANFHKPDKLVVP